MNDFLDLIEPVIPSIVLDSFISRVWRSRIRKGFILISGASFASSLFSPDRLFDGITLMSFGVLLFLIAFELFYNSSRFEKIPLEYAVALALRQGEDSDAAKGFLLSTPGKIVSFRLGISFDDVKRFLASQRTPVNENAFSFDHSFISFVDYATALYRADKSFESFISARGINEAEFMGTAEWIGRELVLEMKRDRSWSKEELGRISSIGTSLDYGTPYELSRFSRPIESGADLLGIDLDSGYRSKEVTQIENILSRSEEANALIVDDDESVAEAILLRLAKKIRWGISPAKLEHKHIVRLDWNSLLSEKNTKALLEPEILSLLSGAMQAGNTIIYIPNFPAFMTSSKALNVSVASLLEDIMKSKDVQLIIHASKVDFHYLIENNIALTRMFERLIPEAAGVDSSMPPLIEKARMLEFKYKKHIFFSFPALLSIAESADRYLTYGEMPGKALDLLLEITPWAAKRGIDVVLKSHVALFVSSKTGIAVGSANKEEQDKLAHLEDLLHSRIVGQKEAVDAIASAMRRARSGITNPKRPFASFLFLGPTGVGKTETTKALAQNFFGGEERMIRFDMSEYKEADALPNLLGSNSEGKSGILASKIRDNPYGVLLLDEFEKASPDVLDLFLQILDEGEFTDALGNKVNVRNMIIIATSNAGADLIWKMMEAKEDLNEHKHVIIDSLIEKKIMKPELLNRFDGVVIFHPLKTNELESIASMMFEKLAERLKKDKQITITIHPSLLQYLVSKGADPAFGARSLNRLLQEKVEDFLARKILSGELTSGDTIEIRREDVVE